MIHNDLLDDVIYCGERLEYADEFLRKIKKIFVGSYTGTISTRYGIQTVVRSYDQAMLILIKAVMKMTTNPSRDQLPVAHVVLHPIIRMVEMMQSSHSDTMLESPDEPTTGHIHTITPDAELLAPAPPTIHHTIENKSPQTIEPITTQQEHDVESIRQSIERFSLPPFTECR